MKAELISVHRFLSMPDGVFIIPIYQRHYSWTDIQCKRLWNDIMEVVTGQQPNHFIGSICCKDDEKIRRGTVIIDGQQRVTTLMILFRALMDSVDDDRLKSIITHNYLINMNAVDDQTRLRLKPVAKDAGAFHKLMDTSVVVNPDAFTSEEKDGNAYKNYWLFRSLAQQATRGGAVTIEEIERVVEDLEVIEIRLQDENAQVVFESLNSTGLTLEQVDLVRNFILMALPYDEQERIYTKYWKPIEQTVGLSRLQDFILNWLVMKRQTDNFSRNGRAGKLTVKTLYEGYRHFFTDICSQIGDGTIDSGLADMLAYAKIYRQLYALVSRQANPSNKLERLYIEFLDGMDTAKGVCLVIYLIRRYENGEWNEKAQESIMTALSSYCTRRIVCGSRPIDFQIAASIIRRMALWDEDSPETASVTFWNIITSGVGSYAFPSNTAFMTGLRRTDMYHVRGTFAKHLLYVLETAGPNSKELPAAGTKISVEHILPQTLSPTWEEYLDEHEDLENYDSHLHMLGNLCLTGYNPELSNRDFATKKKLYETSSFYYTKTVANYQEWTSYEIEQRTTALIKVALRLWPFPSAYDNGNKAVPDKWYPLNTDPFAFRGMKPSKISCLGTEHIVRTWTDFLAKIVEICYETDTNVLEMFIRAHTLDNIIWISSDPSVLNTPKPVPNTPYSIGCGVDSTRIINRAQELAVAYWQAIGIDFRQEIQLQVKYPSNRMR